MDKLGSLDSFIFEGFRFDLAAGGLFRTNGTGDAEPVALGSRSLCWPCSSNGQGSWCRKTISLQPPGREPSSGTTT